MYALQVLLLVAALVAFLLIVLDTKWNSTRVLAFGWACMVVLWLIDLL